MVSCMGVMTRHNKSMTCIGAMTRHDTHAMTAQECVFIMVVLEMLKWKVPAVGISLFLHILFMEELAPDQVEALEFLQVPDD